MALRLVSAVYLGFGTQHKKSFGLRYTGEAVDVIQFMHCLASMHEALGSTLSTP